METKQIGNNQVIIKTQRRNESSPFRLASDGQTGHLASLWGLLFITAISFWLIKAQQRGRTKNLRHALIIICPLQPCHYKNSTYEKSGQCLN